jgi:pimeloyl-ACP methyl ester carboxylesterase
MEMSIAAGLFPVAVPTRSDKTCDSAGHLANLERPAAFNQAVDQFLASLDTN